MIRLPNPRRPFHSFDLYYWMRVAVKSVVFGRATDVCSGRPENGGLDAYDKRRNLR